jgi:hypothetical protein
MHRAAHAPGRLLPSVSPVVAVVEVLGSVLALVSSVALEAVCSVVGPGPVVEVVPVVEVAPGVEVAPVVGSVADAELASAPSVRTPDELSSPVSASFGVHARNRETTVRVRKVCMPSA